MQTLTLSEAQRHLTELVRGLTRGSELVITDADAPVAKLSAVTTPASLRHLNPNSVGAILRPFPSSEDDALGEMLGVCPSVAGKRYRSNANRDFVMIMPP
jgi:antitoxin (DNA-binding transcriptional repressor) of toxin-antitoxin stability system